MVKEFGYDGFFFWRIRDIVYIFSGNVGGRLSSHLHLEALTGIIPRSFALTEGRKDRIAATTK